MSNRYHLDTDFLVYALSFSGKERAPRRWLTKQAKRFAA